MSEPNDQKPTTLSETARSEETTTLVETAKPVDTAKVGEPTTLGATSAAAALALAVTSAANSGVKPKPEPAKTEVAKTELAVAGESPREGGAAILGKGRQHAAAAAAIAVAVGLGWLGGSQALSGGNAAAQIRPEWAEAATSSLRQTQDDLLRLTGDVRALNSIMGAMKESFDRVAIDGTGQQRSVIARVDGIERTAEETVGKIAHLVEASQRIERASTDVAAKLAAMSGRLDGIERPAPAASAKPVTTAPPDGPVQTASVPEPKAAAKEMPLPGWVLHDVQGGVALVESRNGRLHEVVTGQNLPTVGRVEAIERRGRTWVVVTAKGIIGAGRWH